VRTFKSKPRIVEVYTYEEVLGLLKAKYGVDDLVDRSFTETFGARVEYNTLRNCMLVEVKGKFQGKVITLFTDNKVMVVDPFLQTVGVVLEEAFKVGYEPVQDKKVGITNAED